MLSNAWLLRGLAFVAGGLSVLSFAPFGIYPVIILCLALLFRLSDAARPRAAFWLGLAFGVGQFVFGTYWILIALSGVGGAPLPLAIGLLVALYLVLAAFAATVMAVSARVAPAPSALRYLLWLPVFWTLAEWLRSWVFSGFPWLSIGYSQIASPLVGLAPIGGVFAVSWAVALTAGLLVWLSRMPRRWPAGVAGLAVLWIGAGALYHVHWTHPTGKPVSVVLAQGDIDQRKKWSPDAVEQAIRVYANLTHDNWEHNLIIWPETAIPDYYIDVKPALDRLGKQLAAHDTTLVTGLLRSSADGADVYNSVAAIGNGGGFYGKRHLVPFGETFPVPEFIREWMAASGMPYSNFSTGHLDQPLLRADGLKLGVTICYEDVFGALIARDLPQADVLVNVSDDAWFGRSIGPYQHFEIARMRAVETGRFLLRADNSAVTAIVGPRGRVLERAPGFEATTIQGTIHAYAGSTPYVLWRDWGIVALMALLAGVGVLLGRRPR